MRVGWARLCGGAMASLESVHAIGRQVHIGWLAGHKLAEHSACGWPPGEAHMAVAKAIPDISAGF